MKYFAVLENNEVVGILMTDKSPEDDREIVELDTPIGPRPFANATMKLVGKTVVWQVDTQAMRTKRNQLLQETDWIAIKAAETGNFDKAWTDYRQALRDLPDQPGFPDVDFPEPPKA